MYDDVTGQSLKPLTNRPEGQDAGVRVHPVLNVSFAKELANIIQLFGKVDTEGYRLRNATLHAFGSLIWGLEVWQSYKPDPGRDLTAIQAETEGLTKFDTLLRQLTEVNADHAKVLEWLTSAPKWRQRLQDLRAAVITGDPSSTFTTTAQEMSDSTPINRTPEPQPAPNLSSAVLPTLPASFAADLADIHKLLGNSGREAVDVRRVAAKTFGSIFYGLERFEDYLKYAPDRGIRGSAAEIEALGKIESLLEQLTEVNVEYARVLEKCMECEVWRVLVMFLTGWD